MKSTRCTASRQHGFTTTQMVITLAIISVVSTFGVMGIKAAREEFKHQSAVRLFASYVEKARADAVRRHAGSGEESSIETFGPDNPTRYDITMDWGSGALETRSFNLDSGLTFDVAAKKISFDWRGRITKAWVWQIKSAYSGINVPVDVSGSGDITVGEQHFPDESIPSVDIAEVTGDVDADPSPSPSPDASPDTLPAPDDDPNATPTPTPTPMETDPGNGNGGGNGNGTGGNGNGNGNPSPSPTPTLTPTPTPDPSDPPIPQCVSTISPSTLSLSQSDPTKQSGTAVFTMTNATGVRIISAAQAGNGNSLNISLSLQRIDGSGSSVVTVSTKNGSGNRGVFVVNVEGTPSCGSAAQLTVSVSSN